MSTLPPVAPAPATSESRPSPWLPIAVSLGITLAGVAGQWGTLGADVRHLKRRANVTDAEVARLGAAQSKADTHLARIETRLDEMPHKPTPLAAAPCWVGRLGRRVPEAGCTASPPARRTALAAPLSGPPLPSAPSLTLNTAPIPPIRQRIWSKFGPTRTDLVP